MSHWYHPDGTPAFKIKKKNGSESKPNIVDARRLDLIPSVTTILQILSAPELDTWKQNQIIDACKIIPFTGQSNYTNMVIEEAFKESEVALSFGNTLHQYMEDVVKGPVLEQAYSPIPKETMLAIGLHLKEELHAVIKSEMTLVSSNKMYAGTCDMYCQLKDGRKCVYDFKNQGTGEGKPFAYYEKYWLQSAAYGNILKVDCARILNVSRTEPGRIEWKEISGDELKKTQRMFDACCVMFHGRRGLQTII